MMAPLAFLYASTQLRHSVGLGGILVTVWTVAPSAIEPLAGRLYDRIGVAKWSPRALTLLGLGLLAVGASFPLGLPAPALIVLTGLVAITGSATGGCNRILLGECVPERLLQSALSLDSSLIEVTVIGAPLIVAATAVAGPQYPVFAMGAIELLGALLFYRRNRGQAAEGAESAGGPSEAARAGRLWSNPRFVFWLLAAAAFGQSLGTLEIGAVPISERLHHGSAQAAIFVAVLGAASGLAGIAYATFTGKIKLRQEARACVLFAVMAAAGVGVSFAGSAWGVIACYIAIGLCTAPLNTTVFYSVSKEIVASRRAEAFGGIGMTNSFAYAIPGILLAVVSVPVVLRCGAALAVISLLLAPVLNRHRPAGAEQPQPAAVAADAGIGGAGD